MTKIVPGPKPRKSRKGVVSNLPSRQDIVAAMAAHPELDGKRDLARHFGIHGDMRTPFKLLLKELEGEGILTRHRRVIRRTSSVPQVTALDIPTDADPEALHGFPALWNEEQEGPAPRIAIVSSARDRVVPGPGDRVLAKVDAGDGPVPRYSARAMKILEKPRRGQIGIVRVDSDGARLIPIDRKQKEMRIDTGDLGAARDGDLVEVSSRFTGRLMIPKAKVEQVIGNPRSEGAVSLIAIHNLDIPYRFPVSALKEAESAREVGIKGREDWRHLPLVTIDPPDAKDHDDAVHAEPDTSESNPGGHIVTVAIADVAAYVRPGTALDREAYLRGNSVYFPDRVVPMLPERISNELCSLKQGEVRAALAVRMIIDGNGQKKSHSFHRIVFRSAAKLSYQQAQAALDGKPDDQTGPLLEPILRPLWNAYRSMAKARDRRSPLDLDLPERKIILDDEGMVADVRTPERLETMRLIEEFMIAANVAAAETLERHRSALLYRVHDSPSREKLNALLEFLKTLNMNFSKAEAVRTGDFNRVLARAREEGKTEQVSEIVLRSQAQAEYAHENYGHFGLNLDRYAHFTSPIRRYADLIVHRALIAALKLGDDGLTDGEVGRLPAIAQHISTTERRAMLAERETSDRLLAQFLAGKIGAEFMGRISGVISAGMFVRLLETGADGFVPASTIGGGYWRYSEAHQALMQDQTQRLLRIGDLVKVRLVEAAPVAGALRFELVDGDGRGNPPNGKRNQKRPFQRHVGKGRKR